MRTFILTIALISSCIAFSQQEEERKEQVYENMANNELKVNMTNLIAFKFVDFTYERILNEELNNTKITKFF